jgi:hypothetical protein
VAEPDLGGARRRGRGDGAMRGEQEGAVDEEPAPSFASAPAREGYSSDGGGL